MKNSKTLHTTDRETSGEDGVKTENGRKTGKTEHDASGKTSDEVGDKTVRARGKTSQADSKTGADGKTSQADSKTGTDGKTDPIKHKEEVQKSNDEHIDQDYPGFPHPQATEKTIKNGSAGAFQGTEAVRPEDENDEDHDDEALDRKY